MSVEQTGFRPIRAAAPDDRGKRRRREAQPLTTAHLARDAFRRCAQDTESRPPSHMTSRSLLATSALLLGVAGLGLLFAPASMLISFGAGPESAGACIITQLLGAALMGFATVNWTARGMALGGIYGRPIVAGNLIQCGVATLSLLRPTLAGATWSLRAAFTLELLLGAGFVWRLFHGPDAIATTTRTDAA
jgi:hypothetical protein